MVKFNKKLLELNGIEVSNGSLYRLKNIRLSIYQGEKIALLGKSGSGKSSLISVANGSLKPTKGIVTWQGKNLKDCESKQLREIATLWQDLRLIEELDVGQNINAGELGRHNLFWSIKNLLGILQNKTCISCLQIVGLPKELMNSPVSQISGGQRQRVAIARLLSQQARLMLVDEPLSNLDPQLSKEILGIFLWQSKIERIKIPKTSLISLHRPDLIHNFDRVLGLYKGELVIDLPAKGLIVEELNWLYQ